MVQSTQDDKSVSGEESEFEQVRELTGSNKPSWMHKEVSLKYPAWFDKEVQLPRWSNKQQSKQKRKPATMHRHTWVLMFFGVVLPLAAVIFETTSHYCAQHYFDPFPSPAHVALFCLIPLSNFLAWLSNKKDLSAYYGIMALFSGMAMGIGILYSVMFLPITPAACFATVFLGFGLLGLAPLLSLPCSYLSGQTVCHLATKRRTYFNPHQVEHIGHLIILVMVVAVELPSTLTRMHLSMAADPATSMAGIDWLRKFGKQEVMQRACYERSGRATDILGSIYESAHPLAVEDARKIFYRVTGKPFNSVPIPASARATIQHAGLADDPAGLNAGVQDEFDLDTDIAGEAVSGVARGLSVGASTLTGSIDADAALADLNWQFAFKNTSKFNREARAKVLLPPGAVVKRATLIINNVERDATVMVREAARAYYRSAVKEHKDPLLVSTCGPDQILVQCYPVGPESTVDVRLSMAVPLSIDESENGILNLPSFEERNFQYDVPNNIELTSTRSLAAPGTNIDITNTVPFSLENATAASSTAPIGVPVPAAPGGLKGAVDAAQLARFSAIVDVNRDKAHKSVWCPDTVGASPWLLQRSLKPQHFLRPASLMLVVDGSQAMQPYMPEVIKGLENLPDNMPVELALVGDHLQNLCPQGTRSGTKAYTEALTALKNYKCIGGQDDFIALNQALARAQMTAGAAVLWIHAAQPVALTSSDACKQILQNSPRTPLLHDLQVVSGPNEILNGIEAGQALARVSRAGSLSDDLKRLYEGWSRNDGTSDFRTLSGHPATWGLAATESAHTLQSQQNLSKIWAYNEILANMHSDMGRALSLARQYQIISPVSSAVVVDPQAYDDEAIEEEAGNKRDMLADAKHKLFDGVAKQLNNLSTTASIGDYAGTTTSAVTAPGSPARYDQRFESARNKNAEDSIGERNYKGGGFGYAKKAEQRETEYRMQKIRASVDTPISEMAAAPPPSAGSPAPVAPTEQDYSSADKDVFASAGVENKAPFPALQGATNGTVGSPGSDELSRIKEFGGYINKDNERNRQNMLRYPVAPQYSRSASPSPEPYKTIGKSLRMGGEPQSASTPAQGPSAIFMGAPPFLTLGGARSVSPFDQQEQAPVQRVPWLPATGTTPFFSILYTTIAVFWFMVLAGTLVWAWGAKKQEDLERDSN